MSLAQPQYLQNALQPLLNDAAPGHRFNLYFNGWDSNYKVPAGASTTALSALCTTPNHSRKLIDGIITRQKNAADDVGKNVFAYPAIATAPFATGLGNEHPIENGFAFLNPYGLPYLAGSGVKGVIRRAAEELASGEWGEKYGWNNENIRVLFGPNEEEVTRKENPLDAHQGALCFWDVFPAPEESLKNDKPLFAVEIMTPHMGDYYQGKTTPNTSLQPNPISFLAVAAKSRFLFYVEVHKAFLTKQPEENRDWQKLLHAAFDHAGKWLGFGAKTAVGYGRMTLDGNAQSADKKQKTDAIEKQRKEQEDAEKQARLERLSPFDRSIEEVLSKKPKDQPDLKALFNALKAKRWEGEEANKIALRLRTMMQESKQWREKSEKKNPEKDENYQMTKFVLELKPQ